MVLDNLDGFAALLASQSPLEAAAVIAEVGTAISSEVRNIKPRF